MDGWMDGLAEGVKKKKKKRLKCELVAATLCLHFAESCKTTAATSF